MVNFFSLIKHINGKILVIIPWITVGKFSNTKIRKFHEAHQKKRDQIFCGELEKVDFKGKYWQNKGINSLNFIHLTYRLHILLLDSVGL